VCVNVVVCEWFYKLLVVYCTQHLSEYRYSLLYCCYDRSITLCVSLFAKQGLPAKIVKEAARDADRGLCTAAVQKIVTSYGLMAVSLLSFSICVHYIAARTYSVCPCVITHVQTAFAQANYARRGAQRAADAEGKASRVSEQLHKAELQAVSATASASLLLSTRASSVKSSDCCCKSAAS
jgi:hypothetical protein